MAGAAAQMELLEALAETPPRAYLQRTAGGQSLLRELYQQAADADLAARSAADDIARLHALFDVALDHGLGGLVRDYLAEVCSDRLLTSSDPLEAFLLDAECVRRWVQKLLAVSRGRLASWLARGLGGGAGSVPKELGRLQMLQLVAEALAAQQQAGVQAAAAPAGSAAVPAVPAELAEARRLVTCARVLSWLGQAGSGFDRPAGRFFSEQEWRSVAAKRREGAAAAGVGGLILADLTAELARQGVPEAALAYPPPTPDRLLAALLLAPPAGGSGGGTASSTAAKPGSKPAAGSKAGAGGAGGAAGGEAAAAAAGSPASSAASLDARLALLSYYLADGGFMQPQQIVQGLGTHFHVPRTTAHGWLLQQLLDDAHTADAAGAQSLLRAAELAAAVDGGQLPHKALQVFAARGQLGAALSVLRQRQETTVKLDEASVALSVRLQNGLLSEAFMGLRQHLAAVAAAAPPASAPELTRRHAQLLVAQLLQFAAMTRPSAVHAVVRLPWGGVEEQAVVGWLEAQATGGRGEAALMLPLYYLFRGRTPEALHAYAAHCPRTPTSQQQQELAALLTEAARMLPAPQRALVVQHGAAPALLPAGSAGGGGCEVGEEGPGVALMGSIPSVAADVAPALLSFGPTPAEAPLVGSVPLLLEMQRRREAAAGTSAEAAEAGGKRGKGGTAGAGARQQAQPPALLFGQTATAGAGEGGRGVGAGAMSAPAANSFGAAAVVAADAGDAVMGEAAGSIPASGAHEFDRVLGLGAGGTSRGGGAGAGKSKRRWGGSAYR